MAHVKSNFSSVVAIGGQNPQILNVDFLKCNNIIPVDKPPFAELLTKEKPFQAFVSTPPFARLVMNNYEFIVDERRFQVKDNNPENWTNTLIYEIAINYYTLLQHTPVKAIGLNFNSRIIFENDDESAKFQKILLADDSTIVNIIGQCECSSALDLRFPYNDNRVDLTLGHLTKNKCRVVNFNYEFDFENLEQLNNEFAKANELSGYFDQLLNSLLEAI